jgi:S-adenosylmethionine:tRNA ribosyltransferase-isomerase
MRVEDFDFVLPADLIAQTPLATRSASRLLVLDRCSGRHADVRFSDLPNSLRVGDLLIFNDTKVIKARLLGRKDSGGQVEILVERLRDKRMALAQLRTSHRPREGARVWIDEENALIVGPREGEFFQLIFPIDVNEFLDRFGRVPLPPYVARAPAAQDEVRYQTVYARVPGAVAAPTAGLHFDSDMLQTIVAMGVQSAHLTLHVGAGTFQPVRDADLSRHRMHRERYEISAATAAAIAAAKRDKRRVIAVGTTSLRALESWALTGETGAYSGDTELFVLPGFEFRVVEGLLTNFHLPRSTLLMLIAAFAGFDNVRRAYAHAIATGYRFFSYGDAMFISHQN